MPTWNYVTGSRAAFSASIPIPIAYEPIYAQDVSEPVRVLADRTQFLSASKANISGSNWFVGNNHFTGSVVVSGGLSGTIKQTGRLEISGALRQTTYGVTRSIGANKVFFGGNDISGSVPCIRGTTNNGLFNTEFYFPIDDVIVDGCTLNGFNVYVNNCNAPSISGALVYTPYGAWSVNQIGSLATNTSTGQTTISLTGQSQVVDRKTKMYYIYVNMGLFTGTSYVYNAQIFYETTTVMEPSG